MSITEEGRVSPHNGEAVEQFSLKEVSIYTMVVFYIFVMGLSTIGLVVLYISREDSVRWL